MDCRVLDKIYLANEYEKLHRLALKETKGKTEADGFYRTTFRKALVARFAWAVPSTEAVVAIAQHSPLVEIGAGTGYWAHLLQIAGADIKPYDIAPMGGSRNNRWFNKIPSYTKVYQGGPEKAARHSNRTLLLCWPPPNDLMAYASLSLYKGDTVIYIGTPGGNTAEDKFDDLLAKKFDLVRTIAIPQWSGCEDRLYFYERSVAYAETMNGKEGQSQPLAIR